MNTNGNTPPLNELELKHAAALQALIETSGNVRQAAKVSGIGERTIHRWLKTDAHFAAALQEARLQALQMATSKLTMGAGAAVDVLLSIVNNVKVSFSVRVQAAQTILSFANRYSEQLDLSVRLAALEAQNENH